MWPFKKSVKKRLEENAQSQSSEDVKVIREMLRRFPQTVREMREREEREAREGWFTPDLSPYADPDIEYKWWLENAGKDTP